MSLRWTEEQFQEWRNGKSAYVEPARKAAPAPIEKPLKRRPTAARKLKGKSPDQPARTKNGWERDFEASLEARKKAGEIVWYAYEPFRIRLAKGCFYRPDFACVDTEGRTEIYEVKGHMREAARLRLKIALEKLPYPFFLVRKVKGQIRVTKV